MGGILFTILTCSVLYLFFLNDRLFPNSSVEYFEKTFFEGTGAKNNKNQDREVQFLPIFGLLSPPSKKSNYHNFVNIGSQRLIFEQQRALSHTIQLHTTCDIKNENTFFLTPNRQYDIMSPLVWHPKPSHNYLAAYMARCPVTLFRVAGAGGVNGVLIFCVHR